MSRGPGQLQKYLFLTIHRSGKPLTFGEIVKLAYPLDAPNRPPQAWKIRSLRRALHKMVKDNIVLASGVGGPGDPHRYSINPMVLTLAESDRPAVSP
jgi:hypothetical protein